MFVKNKSSKHPKWISCSLAFTKVELLVVLVICALLSGLLIGFVGGSRMGGGSSAPAISPAIAKAIKSKDQRMICLNNLKQVGVAVRNYATDNEGRFPWQISEIEGGSAEYLSRAKYNDNWRHWQALSNELVTPKLLRCPRDGNRKQANSFAEKKLRGAAGNAIIPFGGRSGNQSYSYFLGLESDKNKPNNMLSGDRNVMYGKYNNDYDKKGAHIKIGKRFTAKMMPMWTQSLHANQGNILLSDLSVRQASSSQLAQYLIDSHSRDNTLIFPRGH
jgi:hypothetical protein|tara:strand:+ start:655 stop:1479 length:825 start_codon:yes stop_codon:yes gene_type:complete